jgi:putative CocE/NonD family hydrolase
MSGSLRTRQLGEVDARAEQAMVAMRDGVRLATDVYLPPGPGPFSTVLTRLPYDKTGRDSFIRWVAAYMCERGYAFVAQDTRGKARSEGETMAFAAEVADGYDTLEWLAGQGWCDGAVGMWGESYFGFTQWAAAAGGHPALRAIAPRNTTTAVAGDWFHRQGVPRLAFPLAWAADSWMDSAIYGVAAGDVDWDLRPPAAILPALHGGRTSPSFEVWRRTPAAELEAALGIAAVVAAPARLQIPALHVGGWYDIFQRGQLADWAAARAGSAAPQPLLFDATDHAHARWGEGRGSFDLHEVPDAEIEAFMPEYLDATLDFYDAVLRGRGAPAPTPVRLRPSGGEWMAATDWPPPGAEPLTLWLAGAGRALADADGGGLALRPDPTAAEARWTDDPADPVPSLYADELQAMAAPPDDRAVAARPDVATFTSDPFAAGLTLAGPARARLGVAASGAGGHVTAKLLDVAPDGTTARLRDGAARHGPETAAAGFAVELGSVAHRLAPGHRLRLEVAASSYPQFLPPAGESGDAWQGPLPPASARRLAVGGPAGSALELTTIDLTR